jgi:hypothetical protein
VLREKSLLIALQVAPPNGDNGQERLLMPQRETLAMTRLMPLIRHLGQLSWTLLTLLSDGGRHIMFRRRSPASLAAENLFLRKPLALYQERHATACEAQLVQWYGLRPNASGFVPLSMAELNL